MNETNWIHFFRGITGTYYYKTSSYKEQSKFLASLDDRETVFRIRDNESCSVPIVNLTYIYPSQLPNAELKLAWNNDVLQAIELAAEYNGLDFRLEDVLPAVKDESIPGRSGYVTHRLHAGDLPSHHNHTYDPGHHHNVPYYVNSYGTPVSTTGYDATTYVAGVDPYKTEQTSNKTEQKQDKMKGLMQGLNLEFGKYTAGNIAYSFAGIAVKKKDGTFVVFDRANKTIIEVGDLKFDVDFYKVPTQTLVAGDITVIDGTVYIVEELKTDGTIVCINPTTGSRSNKLKRTNLFNMYFYTKIVSLFDMFQGAPGAQGGNTPFGGINPAMLMMMSGEGKGDMSSMMEMMMMSQMFGGQGGANPFAAFSGLGQAPTQQG